MVVNISFYLLPPPPPPPPPAWEKNTVNVRNVMELSKIHEISYIINGETYVLLCSVTIKIMKFFQEKVKTKENYDCWDRLDRSQSICPKIGGTDPPFTPAF